MIIFEYYIISPFLYLQESRILEENWDVTRLDNFYTPAF